MTDLVLVTIPFSHYCDKARWALDRAGIPYEERAHLPLLHYLPARLAGGGKTVPVLKTPERTLCDSTDILHWVDARLPAPRRLFPDEPEARAEVVRGVADTATGEPIVAPKRTPCAAWRLPTTWKSLLVRRKPRPNKRPCDVPNKLARPSTHCCPA